MPTIRDVAQAAGVSASTASYALSGSTKISQATRTRVLEAAARIGFYPSGAARSLKRRKTGAVGVFLPGFAGPVFGNIVQSIHNTVLPRGYETIVCSTQLSERLLLERHVDGAIILNSTITDDAIARVQRPDYPVVVMERVLDLPHVSCVLADNARGGYLAVRHLIENGRTNIAILSGNDRSHENRQRLLGARAAFTEAGVDFASRPLVQGLFMQSHAYFATQTLLSAHRNIDGLFCLSDEMAIGALRALEGTGRSVPRDIGIVGFDNIELSAYVRPALTTISVDSEKWGQTAANTLIDRIEGRTPDRQTTLPVELVIRQSAGSFALATLGDLVPRDMPAEPSAKDERDAIG